MIQHSSSPRDPLPAGFWDALRAKYPERFRKVDIDRLADQEWIKGARGWRPPPGDHPA